MWSIVAIGDGLVHVLPVQDRRTHEAKIGCWCEPKQDTERYNLFIHNAADRREMIGSEEA